MSNPDDSSEGFGPRTLWILGTRGIPNRYGGFEELSQEIAHEIHVLGGRCEVLPNSESLCRSSRLSRLAISLSPHLMTPVATWLNARRLLHCSNDFVLVANPINILVALRLSRRDLAVVLHLDGLEDQRGKWRRVHKLAHRLARWIAVKTKIPLVADSEAIRDWYQTKYHRDSWFIPYGGCRQVLLDPSHTWQPECAEKYLVIARPVPENQMLEIVRAFNSSGNSGRLEVIGEPTYNDQYWLEICDEAALNPRVTLKGAIWQKSELCKTILCSSALIHGHSVGGTNPSLVYAASHGIPVIAHDNPFNREVLGEGGNFWSNQNSLCNILEKPFTSLVGPDFHRCASRYDWRRVTDDYLKLFIHISDNQV